MIFQKTFDEVILLALTIVIIVGVIFFEIIFLGMSSRETIPFQQTQTALSNFLFFFMLYLILHCNPDHVSRSNNLENSKRQKCTIR